MPNKFIPPQTTTTTRIAATPIDGEILYDTDEKKLYYGDGTTVGGKAIGSSTVSNDVLEYANYAAFPETGEAGKIYIDLATNKVYRWSGSTYVEISNPFSGSYNDLSDKPTLGTAAALDVGTSANNVVQLDNTGKLPAIDGSQLTGITGSGGGHTIQDEGVNLTQRSKLNFVGGGVEVTDNAGTDTTTVTITGSAGNTFPDNVFRIQDNSDNTKQLAFETSGITTGTTRTLTVPDSNGTVLSTDTLTDKALYYYDASSKLFKPIGIGTLGQTLIAQPSSNPPYQWATPTGGGREVLTANRTYYVRTDGSDSNDGLSNTAGGAFLTWNKALAVVSEIDLGNFNIEITDGIGATYTENIVLPYYRANNGRVTLSAHASGTTLACSSGNTVTCDKSGTPSYTLENFTITAHEICIFLDGKTELFFAGINFGACGLKHIAAFRGALVKATGNYTISGDPGVISAISGDHAFVVWGAMFICNVTVTLSGSRNFGGKFVQALRMGACDFEYLIIVGSATGQRYTAVQMGFIKAPASGSDLPGSIAGTTGTGGIYA